MLPALAGGFFTTEPPRKPYLHDYNFFLSSFPSEEIPFLYPLLVGCKLLLQKIPTFYYFHMRKVHFLLMS